MHCLITLDADTSHANTMQDCIDLLEQIDAGSIKLEDIDHNVVRFLAYHFNDIVVHLDREVQAHARRHRERGRVA